MFVVLACTDLHSYGMYALYNALFQYESELNYVLLVGIEGSLMVKTAEEGELTEEEHCTAYGTSSHGNSTREDMK